MQDIIMYRKVIIVLVILLTTFFVLSRTQTSTKTSISQKTKAEAAQAEIVFRTPSVDQIFAQNHSWTATLSAERKRTILATGDIIPARVVNIQATKFNNFLWPFEKTATVARDADITFIDLETPLIKDCPLINDGFKFCGSDKHMAGLLSAGVDVATLANNHIGNYGNEAIAETAALLNTNGILTTGQHGPVYKDIRGVTFAFLGYNDIGFTPETISDANESEIKNDIAEAKKNADVVIVQYHWGEEYRSQPDERQKYLGHFTIDSGADLVIGNHPHWIQPVELYKGKLITYAHGNFVFDQEWSLKTKQGVLGRYTFYDDKLADVEFIPIQIEDYGQPYILKGDKKQEILGEMKKESLILSANDNIAK
jgi:poly-gamma-glutamate synthesis protein (capsule biosynthesis protein)